MNATPPPGWYPDNAGTGQRYWDGGAWTEHTAPLGVVTPQQSYPPAAVVPHAGAAAPQQNWFIRHKVLSGVLAFVLLILAFGAIGGGAEDATRAAADSPADTVVDADADPDVAEVAEPEPEPVDTDGDGVVDEDDFAPEDRKVQTRDDVDSDKDGVADYQDAFPKNPKFSKDADGDGVADQLDAFPKDDRYSSDVDGDKVADAADAFPRDPSRSKVTLAMENARSAAKDYLSFSPFSRQGLIDQLSSSYGSGFKVEDATWAVDQLTVDWKEQAVRAAKDYLDFSPFSRQGLIDQLSSAYGSQFTVEEATYAVNKIGL